MHETIIQIRQAIDRKNFGEARHLGKEALKKSTTMSVEEVVEIRALLGWVHLLSVDENKNDWMRWLGSSEKFWSSLIKSDSKNKELKSALEFVKNTRFKVLTSEHAQRLKEEYSNGFEITS